MCHFRWTPNYFQAHASISNADHSLFILHFYYSGHGSTAPVQQRKVYKNNSINVERNKYCIFQHPFMIQLYFIKTANNICYKLTEFIVLNHEKTLKFTHNFSFMYCSYSIDQMLPHRIYYQSITYYFFSFNLIFNSNCNNKEIEIK